MKSFILITILLITGLSLGANAQTTPVEKTLIRIPKVEDPTMFRAKYFFEILRGGIELSNSRHGEAQLVATQENYSEGEILKELEKPNRKFDIAFGPATKENFKKYVAIQVPLYRGISGQRVLITKKALASKLSAAKTTADAQKLKIGSGTYWEDTGILRSAGFTVVTADQHSELYEKLNRGEIDGVLRGAYEAASDVAFLKAKYPDFIVDESLLITYPVDFVFYVPKTDQKHLLRLVDGLFSYANSPDHVALWRAVFKNDVDLMKLDKRTVIRLDNPTLPPEFLVNINKFHFPVR